YLNLAIEGNLPNDLVLRALDLHEEVRPAHPMCAAVDRMSLLQDDDHVRTPIIVHPIGLSIADISACLNSPATLHLNDVEENYREAGHEILVRILGKRMHDIYSFPNFVISIYFPLLVNT